MLRRSFCALVPAVVLAASAQAQVMTRVIDLAPGSASSDPCYLTVYNNELYFRAKSQPTGYATEMWKFDGVTAQKLSAITGGATGNDPTDPLVVGGKLFYTAGNTLWQWDGASATPAPGFSGIQLPQELATVNGVIFFRGTASATGTELYKYDPVARTTTLYDLFPGQQPFGAKSSYPQHFLEYNGQLYFNACDPVKGMELMRTNGTAVTTLTDIWPGADGSSPEVLTIYDNNIYFRARTPTTGAELYRYSPSQNNVLLKADIVPGSISGNPSSMCAYGDSLYFAADDGEHGFELWRYSDNTSPQVLEMVIDINTHVTPPGWDPEHHANPSDLTVFDGKLYFSADDGFHGTELWCHDGTNTYMVADIWPGEYGSGPADFTIFQNMLYFRATDPNFGSELGMTDGVFRLMLGAAPQQAMWASQDANWASAASWASRTIPTASLPVILDDGGIARITTAAQAQSLIIGRYNAGTVIVGAGGNLSTPTITIAEQPASTGSLQVAGGQVVTGSVQGAGEARLEISSGTMTATDIDLPGNSTVNVSGGQLSARSLRCANLQISGGRTALAGDGPASIVANLQFAGSPGAWQGQLDLGTGALVYRPESSDSGALARLTDQIRTGRAAGAWTGNGIVTSAAIANPLMTLGIRPGDGGEFAGVALDSNSILIRYTYAGDANLDGRVDIDDYFAIDTGYSAGRSGYANGDFNYSGGAPDGDDYFLIDASYVGQGASIPAPQSVPEPTALALLAGAALLLNRRKR